MIPGPSSPCAFEAKREAHKAKAVTEARLPPRSVSWADRWELQAISPAQIGVYWQSCCLESVQSADAVRVSDGSSPGGHAGPEPFDDTLFEDATLRTNNNCFAWAGQVAPSHSRARAAGERQTPPSFSSSNTPSLETCRQTAAAGSSNASGPGAHQHEQLARDWPAPAPRVDLQTFHSAPQAMQLYTPPDARSMQSRASCGSVPPLRSVSVPEPCSSSMLTPAAPDPGPSVHRWPCKPQPQLSRTARPRRLCTCWPAAESDQVAIMEMLSEEQATAVYPSYLDYHGLHMQPESRAITPTMRLMAVNWLSEVACELDLTQRVLSMAVLLLDRYLSIARQFPKTMLQLAAATALFIACKVEGVLPHPRGSRIAEQSDGAFDLSDLVAFERVMVHTLGFDLYAPTAYNFLEMWLHVTPQPRSGAEVEYRNQVKLLAAFLLELASNVYDTLHISRSVLATAALLLALSDTGLVASSADAMGLPRGVIAEYARRTAQAVPTYAGPHVSMEQVVVACGELWRLHCSSRSEENHERFVVVKFSSPHLGQVASHACPMSSREALCAFLQPVYVCMRRCLVCSSMVR